MDDPPPHAKATREDWLRVAKAALVTGGVGEVKILPLGRTLDVSRSSFYWYFKDREDLLEALLDDWERRNTGAVATACVARSRTITEAVATLFLAFVAPGGFDYRLDFAIREWSRRSAEVRARVDASDAARLAAIAAMFTRHGYAAAEAEIRARILYYQQIGYYALDLSEPLDERLARVPGYLFGFTGQHPDPAEVAAFEAAVRAATAP